MKTKRIVLNLVFLLSFILSACGGAATETMMEKPTEAAMMDKPTEGAMPHETPAPEAMTEPTQEAMMESPAWYGVSLTNVQNGSAFTIHDLKGKVVLVETMAIWCSSCKRQQEQVKALHSLLGERDDFVSLGLDIDPNESADALKSYVEANGFDWHYAVPPVDVVREIASLYGDQFLNPPSTPMLIIDRKGAAHPLPFGVKSADDLMKALQPFLDEAR
jgi:cytochrome oxidase Cu insertion factor (SCO1/SenC/PrrC family)